MTGPTCTFKTHQADFGLLIGVSCVIHRDRKLGHTKHRPDVFWALQPVVHGADFFKFANDETCKLAFRNLQTAQFEEIGPCPRLFPFPHLLHECEHWTELRCLEILRFWEQNKNGVFTLGTNCGKSVVHSIRRGWCDKTTTTSKFWNSTNSHNSPIAIKIKTQKCLLSLPV